MSNLSQEQGQPPQSMCTARCFASISKT